MATLALLGIFASAVVLISLFASSTGQAKNVVIPNIDCEVLASAVRWDGDLFLLIGRRFVKFSDTDYLTYLANITELGLEDADLDKVIQVNSYTTYFLYTDGRQYVYDGKGHLRGPINDYAWSDFVKDTDASLFGENSTYFFRGCYYIKVPNNEFDHGGWNSKWGDHDGWDARDWNRRSGRDDRGNVRGFDPYMWTDSSRVKELPESLPCSPDAGWEDRHGDTILAKNDKLWKWHNAVNGPIAFKDVYRHTNWVLCPEEAAVDFNLESPTTTPAPESGSEGEPENLNGNGGSVPP